MSCLSRILCWRCGHHDSRLRDNSEAPSACRISAAGARRELRDMKAQSTGPVQPQREEARHGPACHYDVCLSDFTRSNHKATLA